MTFPDKYLQSIVFKVEFQEVSETELLALQSLFNSVFNLVVDTNTLKAIPFSSLKFGDSEKMEQWELNSDSVMITIDGAIFKTFDDTVVPLADRIQRLLGSVRIKVNRLYLNEIFIIPDFDSGSIDEMRDKEHSIFSDKLLNMRQGNVFLSNDTATMYRSTESNRDKKSFNIIWGAIARDDNQDSPQPSRYILDVGVIDREPFEFNSEITEKARAIGKEMDLKVKSLLVESFTDKSSGNLS